MGILCRFYICAKHDLPTWNLVVHLKIYSDLPREVANCWSKSTEPCCAAIGGVT